MAKYKVVGGKVEEQPEPESGASEVSKSSILERFKPAMDAIETEWEPFPEIEPGFIPTGPWVVVQKRMARPKVGSIITGSETRDVDGWRERVARLLLIGPGAYKDLEGQAAFAVAEGWPQPGDMVVIPENGGTKFTRKSKSGKPVEVLMFHWRDLMGIVQDVSL